MEREKLIKLIEQKELELKKLSNEISVLKMELQNNIQIVEMTIDDKLKIYADYFKGRDDIYPYLSINKNDPSKKYYIPACINEWKQGLAFASICDKYNVPISIEKSRSGKGIHAWIFFEDRIKALTARKLGSLLLSKTMEIRDNLKIDSFDRMFPNQDYLPKGGYGNLIALPFQTEPAKYGNTIFIDRNFIPIKGQFEYLKQVIKLSKNDVFEKIRVLSSETIDVSHQDLDIKTEVKNKRKNNFKFPKKIDVVLDDMIYIDKANLNAGVKNSFRRLATFANPEFYKKQRMRFN